MYRTPRAPASATSAKQSGVRSNDVFSRMTREQAERFLEELRLQSSTGAAVALSAAANAFKLRPQFLRRQPRARQAEWMRRALSRAASATVAEEVLAEYFLAGHRKLVGELLDAFGVDHEDGELRGENPPCPDSGTLENAVQAFRKGEGRERRDLLLRAFAAQTAISWPELEALLDRGTDVDERG